MERLNDVSRNQLLRLIFKMEQFQSYLVHYVNYGSLNKQKFRKHFGDVIKTLEGNRCNSEFRLHGTILEKRLANTVLTMLTTTESIFCMVSRHANAIDRICKEKLLSLFENIVFTIERKEEGQECRISKIDVVKTCQKIVAIEHLNSIQEFLYLFYCILDNSTSTLAYCGLETSLSFVQRFEVAIICNAGFVARHLWSNATEDDKNSLLGERKEATALQLASVVEMHEVVNWFLERDVSANCQWQEEDQRHPCQNTILHLAAKAGNLRLMEILIEKGANVNARNANGESPLHAAAEGGFPEALTILWNSNSEFDPRDSCGNSPLHSAADKGHVDVVNLLLENKAAIEARNHQQTTPLHVAVIREWKNVIELLLKKGADINAVDSLSQTPLRKACERDLSDVVDLLLNKCHASMQLNGMTELHVATRKGYYKSVLVLLAYNANVNAVDAYGKTPLHYAAQHGRLQIAEKLMNNNADSLVQDKRLKTALHDACWHGYQQICELFLKQENENETKIETVVLINLTDINGQTPLHYAARNGHVGVANHLLRMKGLTFSSDKKKRTALHEAAWNGHEEIVDSILKACPNSILLTNMEDYQGATALSLASKFKHESIVDLLTANGGTITNTAKATAPTQIASIKKISLYPDVNGKNDSGDTKLHIEVRNENISAVADLLKDKTLKVNLKNSKQETAMHLAARIRCSIIMEMLLTRENIDSNAKNGNGDTPLHCAVREENMTVLGVLFRVDLRKKVNINPKNMLGETPLHLAVQKENAEVVKLLSTRSVDFVARTTNGKTALQIAIEKGNLDIVKLLLDSGDFYAGLDEDGNSILHLAVKRRSEPLVNWILSNHLDLATKQNHKGNTCLHLAVKTKQVAFVRSVLQSCSVLVNVRNCFRETPLLLAAKGKMGYNDVIKCLLEIEAIDVNAKLPDSRTALHVFAGKIKHTLNEELTIALLRRGADLLAKDNNGETALHAAIRCNCESMAHCLLANNANLINLQDIYGNTPLHVFAKADNRQTSSNMLKILLRTSGIDVNVKNDAGEIPLHLASQNGRFELVNQLLNIEGIRIDEVTAHYYWTPLALAVQNHHWGIVSLLLHRGANPDIEVDIQGSRPLDVAKSQKQHGIVAEILQSNRND